MSIQCACAIALHFLITIAAQQPVRVPVPSNSSNRRSNDQASDALLWASTLSKNHFPKFICSNCKTRLKKTWTFHVVYGPNLGAKYVGKKYFSWKKDYQIQKDFQLNISVYMCACVGGWEQNIEEFRTMCDITVGLLKRLFFFFMVTVGWISVLCWASWYCGLFWIITFSFSLNFYGY